MKLILTDDTGFDFLSGFLVPKIEAWSAWTMSTSMTALPRLLPPALRRLFRLLSDGPPSILRSQMITDPDLGDHRCADILTLNTDSSQGKKIPEPEADNTRALIRKVCP